MKAGILFAGVASLISVSADAKVTDQSVDPYGIGKCIVRTDRALAARLLQDLPLQLEAPIAAGQLAGAGKCLKGRTLSSPAVALRGGIAQALLLQDFPRFGVQPKIPVGMFARFDLPSDQVPLSLDSRTLNLYKLADCVVRNQGMKIETLFRAKPGSGIEERLLDSLGPYVVACNGAEVAKKVSRRSFRSLLAQSAYDVSARYWSGELWSAE